MAHGTDGEPASAETLSLAEAGRLLDDVVDIQDVLTDEQVDPAPGSLAAEELRRARSEHCPAGAWGEEPVHSAYALAILNYRVALDHATAIAAMTKNGHSAVSASVVTRALVELASQAWWLLEPDIGHVSRVERMIAIRFRSAREGEKTASADGVPVEVHHTYTETTKQVAEYAKGLGLQAPRVDTSKPWRVFVCGNEMLPTASWRIKEMFADIDLPSVYALFSGYSHGELFALLREFERTVRGDLGTHYRSVTNQKSFIGAVAVASYALHPPAQRLVELFGLGRSE